MAVPELPEVETVVRDLRPGVQGRRIISVTASSQRLRNPWSAAWGPCLVGRIIRTVHRRGKWILCELNGGSSLVFHLGMTGQLTIRSAAEPVSPHTHLTFGLSPGSMELRYVDIRRFGGARFFSDSRECERFFEQSGLGPEPFNLDRHYWAGCLRRTDRCLKAVLLDQRVVAGVGNIYADESLFEAGLYPGRPGSSCTPEEAQRLARSLATVLKRAIRRRGASIRNYVGGFGLRGKYQTEFRVYQRSGEPCWRCQAPIAAIRLAGRSTHYCPRCQPAGAANANRALLSSNPRARAAGR